MAQVSKINMGGIDYDIRDKVLEQEVAKIQPIVNQGTINNAADEEDITSENNLLKLKNRSTMSGMGYVILRKDKSFAEQISESNTIYEIRYDFDLQGKDVELPNNCVLLFMGGILSNGKLQGSHTCIQAGCIKIFNESNISFGGTWNVDGAMPEWMGAYPVATRDEAKVYNGVDVGGVINKLYGITDTIVLSDGYYVSWTGVTIAAKNIRGNGKTSNIFSICYYDDQDAVKWGYSTEIAERVWGYTIQGVSIYSYPRNNVVRSSALKIAATTRCVLDNVTLWNYAARQTEWSTNEINDIAQHCNYGLVIEGESELLTISDFSIAGDIGVYFKTTSDFISLLKGYIQGSGDYSFAGIYGKTTANFAIANTDIATGLNGIYWVTELKELHTQSIENVRIEQLRRHSSYPTFNIRVDNTSDVLKILRIKGCLFSSEYAGLFKVNNTDLYVNGCSSIQGGEYLGNAAIETDSVVVAEGNRLDTNGKSALSNVESFGMKTPNLIGSFHTGTSIADTKVSPIGEKEYCLTNGYGKFVREETGSFAEWKVISPLNMFFASQIKKVLIEVELIDDEYYQRVGFLYNCTWANNVLTPTFVKELYNEGDDIVGHDNTKRIEIGKDGNASLGYFYWSNTLGRPIWARLRYTYIAPSFDGNRL